MTKLTMRQMFRFMHAAARIMRHTHPGTSAFWLAENAELELVDTFGYDRIDIDEMLRAANAVLWAVHWRFMTPQRELKLWQSERRYAVDTIDGVMVTSHPGPRLP